MKIRKATKKDLKEISEIFRVESSKKPYNQEWTKKTAFEDIRASFKKDDMYVVTDKNIIGFIICEPNNKKKRVYIDELWLKSDYQGKGIGKTLMKFVEEIYKKKGFKTISLTSNKKARAVEFYKKLNYKIKHELFYMTKKLR